jgi:hypothetical protein
VRYGPGLSPFDELLLLFGHEIAINESKAEMDMRKKAFTWVMGTVVTTGTRTHLEQPSPKLPSASSIDLAASQNPSGTKWTGPKSTKTFLSSQWRTRLQWRVCSQA